MAEELLNTKEVAQYLGVHEKQVYALVNAGRLPGTRITGKWMFPKKLLDEWIAEDARRTLGKAKEKAKSAGGALLAAGSNDPVLELLGTELRRMHAGRILFCASTGSTEGLKALDRGHADLAWSHLLEPSTGEYNLPFLPTLTPNIEPAVVNFFHRDLGLVAAAGNPLALRGWDDLGREGLRLVNRQAGSGTRVLLDHHLKRLGVDGARMKGYEREACTHLEVGLAVAAGEADVGLATASIAKVLGLSFVPLLEERFDIVLDRKSFFEAAFQEVMDVLTSGDFRTRVGALGGYSFRECGRVLTRT